MAQVVPFIALFFSAVSVAQQHRAARRAENLANLNAAFKREETNEEVRRATLASRQRIALAKAKMYGTGFYGESFDLYLQDLEQADKDQIAWMQKAGESQAQILQAGGAARADEVRHNAWSTLGQGIASSYSLYTANPTNPSLSPGSAY